MANWTGFLKYIYRWHDDYWHEVEDIGCKPRSLGQESYNLGTREKCLHEIEKIEDDGRQININI